MIPGKVTIHAYRPETLLRVTGEDAFGFLQGQFTNELRRPPGSATYGLWLNHKGKVIADSHVLRLAENEFLLASVTSPVAVIRPKLEASVIADDVTLQDETGSVHGLALVGPGCGEILKQVFGGYPAAGGFWQSGGMIAFAGRRTHAENFELFGPEKNIGEAKKQLIGRGGVEVGAAGVELARISAGLPAIPQDLGPADLPNEGGLDESALSYTKGCYLGQEVMARLKNKGTLRRRLHVVRGAGAPPPLGTLLYQGAEKIGEVRSAATKGDGFVALAMLSLLKLEPKAGLSVSSGESPGIKIDLHG